MLTLNTTCFFFSSERGNDHTSPIATNARSSMREEQISKHAPYTDHTRLACINKVACTTLHMMYFVENTNGTSCPPLYSLFVHEHFDKSSSRSSSVAARTTPLAHRMWRKNTIVGALLDRDVERHRANDTPLQPSNHLLFKKPTPHPLDPPVTTKPLPPPPPLLIRCKVSLHPSYSNCF